MYNSSPWRKELLSELTIVINEGHPGHDLSHEKSEHFRVVLD